MIKELDQKVEKVKEIEKYRENIDDEEIIDFYISNLKKNEVALYERVSDLSDLNYEFILTDRQ